MEAIAFQSASSITAQWTSSRQHLEALTRGPRDALNISVLQDLAWRLINLLSLFRLQVNTWRGMLPLFLCASDGTSPNRTKPSLQPTPTASTGTHFKSTLNSISSLYFLPFSMSWERNKLDCLVSAVNQKVTCSWIWPFSSASWVGLAQSTVPGLQNSKKQVELHYKVFICVMLEFICSCLRLWKLSKFKLLHSCMKHFVLTFFSCQGN